MFIDLGFRLGFGGAMTFDRAHQIRHLAATVPETALVLETDAPDIPPHWLYRTAARARRRGATGRNEPAELPRIAATLAELRGWTLEHTAAVCPRTRSPRCRGSRLWQTPRLDVRSSLRPCCCGLPPVIDARTRLVVLGSFPGRGLARGRPVLRPPAQPVLAAALGDLGRRTCARCRTRSAWPR